MTSCPPARRAAWLAGLLATGLIASLPAFAHSKLLSSLPRDGASVDAAPTELRLQFNEAVEPGMTAIELVAPDGKATAVSQAHADPASAAVMVLPLPPATGPGAYRVRWSTMGRDGHHVHGEIGFSVK